MKTTAESEELDLSELDAMQREADNKVYALFVTMTGRLLILLLKNSKRKAKKCMYHQDFMVFLNQVK